MRVAVVQFAAGAVKSANLARLRELVSRAAEDGAELIVAPEAAMLPFGRPEDPLAAAAETLRGPFVTGLGEVAAARNVTVLAGMFETVPGDPSRAFNTVVALGPGGLLGRYRKLHLFDALGWAESDRLVPGEFDGTELLAFDCGELRIGVLTCYDVRFPELTRVLVDQGVTVFALPAAWVAGPGKEDQWATLVRARAIESTCYVVAADQCAPTYAGTSMIVDPLGVPLAQASYGEGIAIGEVSAARVAAVRRQMPSLRHRRFRVQPGDPAVSSGW